VVIIYDLYRIIANTDVWIESELSETKVPIVFPGTVGFSLRRDGRYSDEFFVTKLQ
jgi:hypothetical protein